MISTVMILALENAVEVAKADAKIVVEDLVGEDVLKPVMEAAKKVVLETAKIPAYTQHQASPLTNRLQITTNPVVTTVQVVAKIVAVPDAETRVEEIAEPIVRVNAKPIVLTIVHLPVKEIVHITVAANVPRIVKPLVYLHVKVIVLGNVAVNALRIAKAPV